MSPNFVGAPGLDFQTWETSNVDRALSASAANAGCPTLAASLFLRLGWDAKKLDHFSLLHPNGASAGCPTLAASLFLRLGWDAKKLDHFSNVDRALSASAANAGCPTLAASLFLRLGWDAKKLDHFSLVHPNGASAA